MSSISKNVSSQHPRKSFSPTTILALCAQVSQICPKCAKPLFIAKRSQSVKDFEIAHIYPLNPTLEEVKLLQSESKLCDEPNDERNLIPLCFTCHKLYDTAKTLQDYRELKTIKEQLISQTAQLRIFHDYQIEKEITLVIDALMKDEHQGGDEVEYVAKNIDIKLNGTISGMTKQKIKNDVSSFYLFIREQFAELERKTPMQAVLIASQVKTFYLKQKNQNLSQQEIFQNTVRWIRSKSPNGTDEAAAAVAAFFVQNCELF
ncbi:ABC-three component system protein [Undibacterium sp. TC4M20W]|uniref:ABC-three component system protein n=1 Tax=Undibacterium sp. TC4M20W TaxID=3413052 RepID=UPI003BEFB4C7